MFHGIIVAQSPPASHARNLPSALQNLPELTVRLAAHAHRTSPSGAKACLEVHSRITQTHEPFHCLGRADHARESRDEGNSGRKVRISGFISEVLLRYVAAKQSAFATGLL
jgi:hypothetical protein